MIKRSFLVSLVIFVTIIISLGCAKKQPEEIKIGATLPLTGDVAVWGNNTKEGIELAVDEINKVGGINDLKVKIVYEDTQALPQNGVSAIKKLITVDRVPAVIDDSVSSVTLAMVPIAEQNKVVLLATGATAPKISEAGYYIFRIWNSDALALCDDIIDLIGEPELTGKPFAGDIKQHKPRLPLIHFLSNANRMQKATVQSILRRSEIDDKKASTIVKMLHDCGSLEYCIDKCKEYCEAAIRNISPLSACRQKDLFIDLANLISRFDA